LYVAWARWSGPQQSKGVTTMFANYASARQSATVFAGAFVSAMLLVSAATSLPIV